MWIGSDRKPNIRSAKAIMMTMNKLLLRRLLFTANRTRVSPFPTTINRNEKIKAAQNATPSALEGTLLDEMVALSELVLAAAVAAVVTFIFSFH